MITNFTTTSNQPKGRKGKSLLPRKTNLSSSEQGGDATKSGELSPKSVKKRERQHRPSFQGLSVIEGKGKRENNQSVESNRDGEFKRKERRRRSLDLMKRSAQSEKIRALFENALEDCVANIVTEGTAEDRLQAILTKAKENGMTTDRIFSFFSGGDPNKVRITKISFLEALETMEDTVFVVNDEELTALVRKIDKNGDDEISLAEFQNYCYTKINSVPWKAERRRLEQSGEMNKLKAQISRQFKEPDEDESEVHSCGDEVFSTSKFFWRDENTIEIKFYYCHSLNVITLQLFSVTFGRELPSLHVCKERIIDYQQSETQSSGELPEELSNGEKTQPMDPSNWESIAKYLVARLKVKKCCGEIGEEDTTSVQSRRLSKPNTLKPFLSKLTGDKYDTLAIEKPLNLGSPPPFNVASSTEGDFQETMERFQSASRSARTSRKSAQELTDLVNTALSEVKLDVAPSNPTSDE